MDIMLLLIIDRGWITLEQKSFLFHCESKPQKTFVLSKYFCSIHQSSRCRHWLRLESSLSIYSKDLQCLLELSHPLTGTRGCLSLCVLSCCLSLRWRGQIFSILVSDWVLNREFLFLKSRWNSPVTVTVAVCYHFSPPRAVLHLCKGM